jgi:acetate kinase
VFRVADASGRVVCLDPEPLRTSQDVVVRFSRWLVETGAPAAQAIGHRVVHGGPLLRRHCRIDDAVLGQLTAARNFAPLHTPAVLSVIRSAQAEFPGLPQVACFDTVFHARMPAVTSVLPLPAALRAQGIQRYGFHGLSCESIVQQLAQAAAGKLPKRLLIAHLGNGASVTAARDGVSVDTSMGLTPSGGLIMGTRSGDLDPGVLAHIASSAGLDLATTVAVLNRQSGLLGLSGLSNDMRELTAARAAGHPGATLAIAVFCYRLAKTVAALAVPLGGLDALVFTGGIGEHSALVRELTLERLGFLGFQLDPAANAGSGERPVDQTRRAWVIPTDEELMIARETAALLATAG